MSLFILLIINSLYMKVSKSQNSIKYIPMDIIYIILKYSDIKTNYIFNKYLIKNKWFKSLDYKLNFSYHDIKNLHYDNQDKFIKFLDSNFENYVRDFKNFDVERELKILFGLEMWNVAFFCDYDIDGEYINYEKYFDEMSNNEKINVNMINNMEQLLWYYDDESLLCVMTYWYIMEDDNLKKLLKYHEYSYCDAEIIKYCYIHNCFYKLRDILYYDSKYFCELLVLSAIIDGDDDFLSNCIDNYNTHLYICGGNREKRDNYIMEYENNDDYLGKYKNNNIVYLQFPEFNGIMRSEDVYRMRKDMFNFTNIHILMFHDVAKNNKIEELIRNIKYFRIIMPDILIFIDFENFKKIINAMENIYENQDTYTNYSSNYMYYLKKYLWVTNTFDEKCKYLCEYISKYEDIITFKKFIRSLLVIFKDIEIEKSIIRY